ncbi:MAG: NAD(P)H-hydrate dehydratase [Gammaproteobacteria bacterium]
MIDRESFSFKPTRLHTRALFSVAQVRELERLAKSEAGLDSLTLMERAGTESLVYIRKQWPSVRHLGVLAGPGNNGGDGFALARQARDAGYTVRVWTVGAAAGGPAHVMAQKLETVLAPIPFGNQGIGDADEPELWVDALLGTGLNRPPEGLILSAIDRLNCMRAPVLSLDIPSGLDGDTGWVPGGQASAVRASATITFLCHKRGLFTGVASQYVGRKLELVTLGMPSDLMERLTPPARLMDVHDLDSALPPRSAASHKGDWGHLLIVGGGLGYGGAIRLVAEGALRAGAGLVSVVTRPEHVAGLISTRPEAMVHGTQNGRIPEILLKRATIGVIGCGLGQDRWGRALWEQLMQWPKPLVVDADGLNLLAQSCRQRDHWLLTPHPGEAARLLEVSVDVIEKDRFDACKRLAERYRADVVLKGSGTLVSGAQVAVCPFGNAGMASGGMGDFLSGIIGGLGAQGIPLNRAGALGVLVHALAGDDAACLGQRGLLASDLAPFVRIRVNPNGSPLH